MDCHCLLQEIFLSQGSNLGIDAGIERLLHQPAFGRWVLSHYCHLGSIYHDSTYMTSLKRQNHAGRKQVSGYEEWGGLKKGTRAFGGGGGDRIVLYTG